MWRLGRKSGIRSGRCGYGHIVFIPFIIHVTLGELITYLSFPFFSLKHQPFHYCSSHFCGSGFGQVTRLRGRLVSALGYLEMQLGPETAGWPLSPCPSFSSLWMASLHGSCILYFLQGGSRT